MKHRVILAIAYLAVAFVITAIWTFYARTEMPVELSATEAASGNISTPQFSSIVALADGSAISPFIKRRLFVELAQALSSILPSSLSDRLERLAQGNSLLSTPFCIFLSRVHWKAEHYPLLIGAFLVMWILAAGFMFTCRWLVNHFYRVPRRLADVAGAAFGVALLGGNGDWHYAGYPYDFTQAFLFTLALAGMLARQRWFLIVFVLAAYSKETSVLLIAAYLLVAENRRSAACWATVALMIAIFAAVRLGINARFPSGSSEFWFPGRNIKRLLFNALFLVVPALPRSGLRAVLVAATTVSTRSETSRSFGRADGGGRIFQGMDRRNAPVPRTDADRRLDGASVDFA